MKTVKSTILIALVILIAFVPTVARKVMKKADEMQEVHIPLTLNGKVAGTVPVDIFNPRGKIRGDLLVLPGWRFKRSRWHRETRLLEFARRNGYRAVFPEMNISLYASRYHKVTQKRIKWQEVAGGKWIRETMIPWLQKKRKIFMGGSNNFLLGLSTGGRGVALVALQNPGLFTAGAALSGDFDQAVMKRDRLMTRMYGPWSSFKKRWYTVDNPRYATEKGKWKLPLYLGHGTADRIVSISQSRLFYRALKKNAPRVTILYHEAKGAGHDFKYWDSELPAVFSFFKKQEE